MDEQIRNKPFCQIEGCNQSAIGLSPTQKWICGLHLIKLAERMKEERRKYFEIIEGELDGNRTSTN